MYFNDTEIDMLSGGEPPKPGSRWRNWAAGICGVVGVLAVIAALVIFASQAAAHRRNLIPPDSGIDPTTYSSGPPVVSVSPSEAPPSKVASPVPTVTGINALAAPPATKKVAAPTAPRAYDMWPVTALGSQATIDQGKLVTWMTSPTCLLAGHDTEGWAYLSNIPTGSLLHVHTGPCAGDYRAVGHNWQQTKGGAVPAWMSNYALVTQSCTGSTGMGFTEFQKI